MRTPPARAGTSVPSPTVGAMSATRSHRPPLAAPRGERVRSAAPGRRPVAAAWPLLVALLSAAGVWLSWRVFVRSADGQRVDHASLVGAQIGQNRLWDVAEPVLDVVSVGFIAAAVIGCVGIALVRRRWGLALAAAMVLGGANLTTRVLKTMVLDRPDLGYGPLSNTLPSGHTTAAASVAAAVVLVVPPRVRPWAAVLGAGYAGATGVSTLVGQWHRPSDVVAGLLVVLAWAALACTVPALAATDPAGDRRPPTAGVPIARISGGDRAAGTTRAATLLLLAVAAASGAAAVVALRRTWTAADPEETTRGLLTSYGGGALGVVAVAALTFAVLLVLRGAVTRSAGARARS